MIVELSNNEFALKTPRMKFCQIMLRKRYEQGPSINQQKGPFYGSKRIRSPACRRQRQKNQAVEKRTSWNGLHNYSDYFFHFSRRLFPTTLTLLSAMAAPAIMGLSKKPVTGYSTPAATGIPMRL